MTDPDSTPSESADIADGNVARLVEKAYRPETPDPGFVRRVEESLLAAAATSRTAKPAGRVLALRRFGALAASLLLGAGMLAVGSSDSGLRSSASNGRPAGALEPRPQWQPVGHLDSGTERPMSPRPRGEAPAADTARVGDTIRTAAGERRRVVLRDGSVLFVNQSTVVDLSAARGIDLREGEIYVEVAPDPDARFTVRTPDRRVSALGTRFAVRVGGGVASDVVVTHGKVRVSGVAETLSAGQRLLERDRGRPVVVPAPRASHVLDWTRELVAAAESPLVPRSEYTGGALIAIDPWGQEARLTLRKYHVDVHIQDGFARTTIDQTYFNHARRRLEGTFYFPLPADASLSRLAMYVSGRLMEGGMAERSHARNVYESIVHRRKDPALLEWVDGTTFKMRVFPLEAREEKRVILSYTQRLTSLYGEATYRFPAGHNLGIVGDWSFRANVEGAAAVASDSHLLDMDGDGGGVELHTAERGVKLDRDVVLRIRSGTAASGDRSAQFREFVHEGSRYLMLRYRPELPVEAVRKRRDWIFLYESSGNRDPVLARVQADIVRTMLAHAEAEDTFTVLTAATRVRPFSDALVPATRDNVAAANEFLDRAHLVGALDLETAFGAVARLAEGAENPYVVHVGSGVATIGEREPGRLAKQVPEAVTYVGVGVGKQWSRPLMKTAAGRTGGYFTQINPDETVAWRTFDLLSTLATPRLLDVKVIDESERLRFLATADSVAHGEDVAAVARLPENDALPSEVTVTGVLDGRTFERTISVGSGVAGGAGYLPRTWAKLELERLVADGAEEHRKEIVALSKSSYVMSPFTSLLVLETDKMYEQFKVDRGRKDHWALYPAPEKIEVVREPLAGRSTPDPEGGEPVRQSIDHVLGTLLVRMPLRIVRSNAWGHYGGGGHAATMFDLLSGAYGIPMLPGGEWGGPVSRRWDFEVPGATSGIYSTATYTGSRPAWPILTITAGSGLDGSFPASGPVSFTLGAAGKSVVRTRAGEPFVENLRMPVGGQVMNALERRAQAGWADFRVSGLFDESAAFFNNSVDGDFRGRTENVFDRALRTRDEPVDGPFGFRSDFDVQFEDVGGLFAVREGLARRRSWGRRSWGRFAARQDLELIDRLESLEKRPQESYERSGRDMSMIFARLTNGRTYQELIYQRFYVQNHQQYFTDLLAFAPGMNTWRADAEAVLEAEAKLGRRPATGRIDDGARRLIQRARGLGWSRITLPGGNGSDGFDFLFDGTGRYRYERVLPTGLRERVLCDGETLHHVYPDLGVASRRTFTRHHRGVLDSVAPWLLQAPENLARGADVVLVNDSTVDVRPHGAPEDKDAIRLRLVFDRTGRLAERHLVAGSKRVLRVTYGADGTVVVADADDKELARVERKLSQGEAPDLAPDTEDVLVLALPYRTRQHVLSRRKLSGKDANDPRRWSDEVAAELMGADLCHDHGSLRRALGVRYLSNKRRMAGAYSVLLSSGWRWDPDKSLQFAKGVKLVPNPAKHLPGSPLGAYATAQLRREQGGDVDVTIAPEHRFFHERAELATICARWTSGRVGQVEEAQRKRWYAKALDFVDSTKDPTTAWAAMAALWQRGGDTKFQARMADAMANFVETPGLGLTARYERAMALAQAGRREEAREAFLELHGEALDAGVLLPLEGHFRNALQHGDGSRWPRFAQETARALVEKDARPAAVYFALQCHWLGDAAVGSDVLATALADAEGDDAVPTKLAAVEYFWHMGQPARASRLLETLLSDPDLARSPMLHRLAAMLADREGASARALRHAESAMDLRYARLPDLLDLQTVRQDFGMLLSRYQQVAVAVQALEGPVPEDFVRRVVRAADRWRSLDPDATAACQYASQILRALGDKALAWDYLTTPLGARPNESAPWAGLAQNLAQQGDVDLADRAYEIAFDIEPTNAQLLWDRAIVLGQAGRRDAARAVYAQIADGEWQPRFDRIKQRARNYLGR